LGGLKLENGYTPGKIAILRRSKILQILASRAKKCCLAQIFAKILKMAKK
jgi:hypothetical protein